MEAQRHSGRLAKARGSSRRIAMARLREAQGGSGRSGRLRELGKDPLAQGARVSQAGAELQTVWTHRAHCAEVAKLSE